MILSARFRTWFGFKDASLEKDLMEHGGENRGESSERSEGSKTGLEPPVKLVNN